MNALPRTHAHRAITAGLGLALLCGSVFATRPALAQTASVTITQQHNKDATYDAYQLFTADVAKDNTATHVAWASDDMRAVVLAFLDNNGYKQWLADKHPGDGQHDKAQNAVEYIAAKIANSPVAAKTATSPRTTAGRSFANRLARHLAAKASAYKQKASSGKAFEGEQGYWLFATTEATEGSADDAGTAPLWIPLGGSVAAITEKSAVPTVSKAVKEDSTGSWGSVADAHTAQNLSYRLVGTLPTNFDAFSQYHYRLTDTLSKGLDLDLPKGAKLSDHLAVTVGSKTVAVDDQHVKASYDGRVLVVDFPNLMDPFWKDYGIGPDTKLAVEYQAHMNANRTVGAGGNDNEAYVTYTRDPLRNGDGRTKPTPPVKTFAYAVELLKVDEQTGEPLEGVAFTMQVAQNNSDEGSRGLYVQKDGSLGKAECRFVTGSDGTFSVRGLDEGTYTIKEVTGLPGFDLIDGGITLQLSSTLDGKGMKLQGLTGTVSGSKAAEVQATDASATAIDAEAGTVRIRVKNDRRLALPLTGGSGLPQSSVASASVALAAGVGLARRRRRNHPVTMGGKR